MLSAAQLTGQDDSLLVEVGDGHRLLEQVAEDFIRMQQAARNAGIDLALVSSYRSFDRQLTIWNEKWQGKRPILDKAGLPLPTEELNDEEKLAAILTWSALPGASRHHWGTDMDLFDAEQVKRQGHVFELVAAEYQPGGPCYGLATWLKQHASRYGFFRPYDQYYGGVAVEPWHVSHRESALTFETQLSLSVLTEVIRQADILGKQLVLERLSGIYQRYIRLPSV
ncbi:M15 family metallopeptidase [Bowmanella dokdonensis]|uniref:M15 family metallopeptidase n=1 Tax=Bowmanella dokdonensis TaxID=751969 RepID=A0A939DLZ4_9ALTE|nr:M15 family metallopeptidase [Bowmanella dokdonensis]MBN7824590.1 M15 family metallopeptidase [Bowmanella dokdonensis]